MLNQPDDLADVSFDPDRLRHCGDECSEASRGLRPLLLICTDDRAQVVPMVRFRVLAHGAPPRPRPEVDRDRAIMPLFSRMILSYKSLIQWWLSG